MLECYTTLFQIEENEDFHDLYAVVLKFDMDENYAAIPGKLSIQ